MDKKDDFYIGWQEKMSTSNRSFLRKILIPIFIGIPVLVFLFVYFQKPFNAHQFEFGKLTEVTGVYYHTPFPLLIADAGELSAELSKEILLVGYGKLGAKGTMDKIQEKNENLHGKKITLTGTLIYGDGKTLMELTETEASLINIGAAAKQISPSLANTSSLAADGEIIDPKCYFGVMKPGEGKIHKSCAIRCISGGIPPVFRQATGNAENPYEYYLILGEDGTPMNKALLPFVGEQISVQGKTNEFLGWKMLYLGMEGVQAAG